MRIFNRLFSLTDGERDRLNGKSANGTQQKQVGIRSGVQWVGAPDTARTIIISEGHPSPDAERLTRDLALATSAYAFTAIMFRAMKVSEPPLMVVQETDDGEEWVEDHELTEILDEPSPDYDMGELQQLTEIYRLVTGQALWVRQFDTAGRLGRFVPFSGSEFETKAADGRIYGRFEVNTKDGKRIYRPEEVVFFRDINPYSWRSGLSRLDVALSMLDLGHQVNRTVRNFMRKAMFPGGVVSPHHEWDPSEAEFQQYVNRIKAWHSGPANAGEPLVTLGGTTFSRAAIPLKELLPTEMLDRIESVISSVFGIPPIVLGWLVGLKNSPWSQMKEAREAAYEDAIIPRWADIEKKLTRQLLSREERALGLMIRFDKRQVRAIQKDDVERAQVAAAMRQEWTVNERRIYTGQEPLDPSDPRGNEIGTATNDLVNQPMTVEDLRKMIDGLGGPSALPFFFD